MAQSLLAELNIRVAVSSRQQPAIVKAEIPERGRGLVARGKNFNNARETVLWIRKPRVVTLETSRLQERCYQCFRLHAYHPSDQRLEDEGTCAILKSCLGCHTVKYCSKKCQSRSWKECHKFECKIYGTLKPRVLPSLVRAAIRLLKDRSTGQLLDDDWKDLQSLESHQDHLSEVGGERWQDVFLMAKAVQKYSGSKEPFGAILRLCCILTVNSFTLTDALLEPIGLALDPFAAMLNHSCDPNCIIRFDADPLDPTIYGACDSDPIFGSISVDLLRPVKDGEELTISYIDNTFPLHQRQSDLSSRYFFTCVCSRCSKGLSTPCDELLRSSLSAAATDAQSFAIQTLEAATSKPSTLPNLVPTIRVALSRLAQTTTFPVHRYPYAQLRLQLVLSLIASATWHEAMVQSGILVYEIDPILYPEPHHPIRIVNKWRLYRLARHRCVEVFEAQGNKSVSPKLEMMLKMTVVAMITTLTLDRPKGTPPMPASILDGLLSNAREELMGSKLSPEGRWEEDAKDSSIFDEPFKAFRRDPKKFEQVVTAEWEREIEKALKEEREYNISAEEVTETVEVVD